jgi:hypothetical protein
MTATPANPSSFLFSPTVRQRLQNGQFVANRQQRNHPLGLFKTCIRLETAIFTNRLPQLLQALDALNDPTVGWLAIVGQSGLGKTSLARALSECVNLEQVVWLETPVDAEQFATHLCRAFRQPDLNVFDAITAIQQPTLIIINRAHHLLTASGRWQYAEQHTAVLQALLANPCCRVVWVGQQSPYTIGLPTPKPLALPPLSKKDVRQLLHRVLPVTLSATDHNQLVGLTQGHPWRVRLLWRVLKEGANTANTALPSPLIQSVLATDNNTPLEQAVLAAVCPQWTDTAWALLSVLAHSPYPLTVQQLQLALASAFPGCGQSLLPLLEQSSLTPFIPRLIPVQMAHHHSQLPAITQYQLAGLALPWVVAQPQYQPVAALKGLMAVWQHALQQPSTCPHLGQRWVRKTLHQLQQAQQQPAKQVVPSQTATPQLATLQNALQQAITQGHVVKQLELLAQLAHAHMGLHNPLAAKQTWHHAASLAGLMHQPDWQAKVAEGLASMTAE